MDSEYRVVILTEPVILHRGCFGPTRLREAFLSNYEAGRPPHPQDLRATVLHMAVSMFEDFDLVHRLCSRRPDRIGTHILTAELQPGHGVCIADTSGPGHWSIWGIPTTLESMVVDVAGI
jgi:hypothetical protein